MVDEAGSSLVAMFRIGLEVNNGLTVRLGDGGSSVSGFKLSRCMFLMSLLDFTYSRSMFASSSRDSSKVFFSFANFSLFWVI